MEEDLGDGIEIRLISEPSDTSKYPYFCSGRSGHNYFSTNQKKRLDIIVPRPEKPTYSNSFTHPGKIIKDRPKNADVVRFTKAFEATWETAIPINQALHEKLRTYLDAQSNPEN